MSTAFAFAPLSSFLRPEDRSRYRQLEEVQARFTRAEASLRERHGLRVCFNDLVEQPTAELWKRSHINLTAALIIAIQLGVVDRLQKFLPKPAWVVGCSLGDVARTISAGACAFEAALHVVMLSLNEVEVADSIGSTVVVMTTRRHSFTAEDIAWFTSTDLDVSRLSPRLLNVAGLSRALRLLEDKAQQRHWKVFPLLDFPLHSRHATSYTPKARAMIESLPFQAPTSGVRVYSSVLKSEVKRPEEFREEFLCSLVLPHNWEETVKNLVEEHAVRKFVNIGPCRTLSKLLHEMGQDVQEADNLIAEEETGRSLGGLCAKWGIRDCSHRTNG